MNFNAFLEIDKELENQVEKVSKIDSIVQSLYVTFEGISSSTLEIAAASDEQYKVTENISGKLLELSVMNKDIQDYISSFIKNYKIDEEKQRYISSGISALKEAMKKHPYLEGSCVMQKDGLRKAISLDYTDEQTFVNFSHRPYFKEAIKGNVGTSAPYISADTNNYCIAIAAPVKNSNGEIVGIIMADFKL